ncbi:DUF1707 domain-containing protein [Kribbella sp. NBC_01245]|uniref:DUF1707 SHOCT-like domain-containing protein n=1 Tax=Kribbella sp. NBC_01245 TaxID=2903578 RepID=UPI002E2CC7B0|nr:DUF1707 domain-containing protein [Kribbella sp. NBC_01245]
MSLEQPPAPRASDRDREQAAALIQEAHGDGRLDLDELDERLTQIYQAKTRQELVHLTADLEPAEPVAPVGHGGQSDVLTFQLQHARVRREGKWQVPPKITADLMHAQVRLDFTEAVLRSSHVLIEATVTHASILLIIPPGWSVDIDQVQSQGGSVTNKAGDPRAGAPRLQVTGISTYGRITVRHPRGHRWWWPWGRTPARRELSA